MPRAIIISDKKMTDTTLEILLQLRDNASQAMQNFANTSTQSLQKIGQQATAVGAPMAIIGGAILAAAGYAVTQASQVQDANTKLNTSLTNLVTQANAAGGSTSGLATQEKFLQDKIDGLEASNEKLVESHKKTPGAVDAASASISKNNDQIAKLKSQLEGMTAISSLSGASVSDLQKKFDALALSSTNLGFSQQDSINSLNSLALVTKNPADAMQAYTVAMDLARAKGEDLGTATTQVIAGFNGMGKSLQTIGVNVKDGLSGMDALTAISQQVGGSAKNSLSDFSTQTEVMHAQLQALAATVGTTLLPILTEFIGKVSGIIESMMQWAEQHPALTKAITLVVVGLGGLIFVIGSALVIFGTLVASITAIATAFTACSVVVLLTVGWIVAAIVGLAIIVTLIITYHTQIWNFIQTIWNNIVKFLKDYVDFIVGILVIFLNTVDANWRTQWQDVSDFFSKIWNGIQTAFTTAVNFIKKEFQDFINWIQPTINTIQGMVSSITNGISGAISGAEKVIGGVISTGASVTKFATGGIVMGPTLGLVGEAGPEAIIPLSAFAGGNTLGGGGGVSGGNINIIMNNPQFKNQDAVRQAANQIARLIKQNNKTSSL